jgi:hypothetical protein
MRSFAFRGLMAVAVAAGMVASAFAQDYTQDADEESVALDKVPAAVKAKADDTSRGAKFSRAYQDKAKNYRLVGKSAEGALVVVQTTEEGALVSFVTRTPATAKSVPRVVTKGLDAERKKNATLRGFRPGSVEEADVFLASKGKLDHVFQFRGSNGDSDPVQVDVTPEGKVQSVKVVAIHPDSGRVADAPAKAGALPPEIAEAVQMAVPGMRIQGSKTEKAAGLTTYVVNGRDEASGSPVTAEANQNGVVLVVRYDLGGQQMPPEALAAIIQKTQDDPRLAGFRAQKTQRLELRQLGVNALAVQGKNAKGATYEVRVGIESGDVTVVPVAAEKPSTADADAGADGKTAPGKKTRMKKSQ